MDYRGTNGNDVLSQTALGVDGFSSIFGGAGEDTITSPTESPSVSRGTTFSPVRQHIRRQLNGGRRQVSLPI